MKALRISAGAVAAGKRHGTTHFRIDYLPYADTEESKSSGLLPNPRQGVPLLLTPRSR